MGNERREHAETRALMNDAVQPVVGKTSAGFLPGFTLHQVVPHIQNGAPRPPKAVQSQTGYPLPMEKAPAPRSRRPSNTTRRRGTRRRPQTFDGVEIDTMQTHPS